MPLTTAQKATLKAAIVANPAWNAFPVSGDGPAELAGVLNGIALPDFIVSRSTLSRHDILTGTSIELTVFAWAAGAYITRSQGERDAFREMFNSTGSVDPRLSSITAAFADIFSGTGGAGNRAHIASMAKRRATYGERILSTGTGTLLAPATLGFEGNLLASDVVDARNLP